MTDPGPRQGGGPPSGLHPLDAARRRLPLRRRAPCSGGVRARRRHRVPDPLTVSPPGTLSWRCRSCCRNRGPAGGRAGGERDHRAVRRHQRRVAPCHQRVSRRRPGGAASKSSRTTSGRTMLTTSSPTTSSMRPWWESAAPRSARPPGSVQPGERPDDEPLLDRPAVQHQSRPPDPRALQRGDRVTRHHPPEGVAGLVDRGVGLPPRGPLQRAEALDAVQIPRVVRWGSGRTTRRSSADRPSTTSRARQIPELCSGVTGSPATTRLKASLASSTVG